MLVEQIDAVHLHLPKRIFGRLAHVLGISADGPLGSEAELRRDEEGRAVRGMQSEPLAEEVFGIALEEKKGGWNGRRYL